MVCILPSRAQCAVDISHKGTLQCSRKGKYLTLYAFFNERLVEENRYKMTCELLLSYLFSLQDPHERRAKGQVLISSLW